MKKITALFLSAVISIISLLTPFYAFAADVAINKTNFPDAVFLNYVKQFDKNKDNKLSDAEIKAVTDIDITSYKYSNKNVSDLTGIKFFTALQSLTTSEIKLGTLDVSQNANLARVTCNGCSLTKLNLGTAKNLQSLSCNDNELETINLSNASKLILLSCTNNKIKAVNISNSRILKILVTDNNEFTSIKLPPSKSLELFSCRNNKITSLDVSANTGLKYFLCENNELSALDLSKNTALEMVSCYNNKLETVNLNGASNLKNLYCYNNKLDSIDVSGCQALEDFSCSNNNISSLNLNGASNLKTLFCYNNKLDSVDISGCQALEDFSCSNNNISSLNLSDNHSLQELNCSWNALQSLDVTKLEELKTLICSHNCISKLDVLNNTKLSWLDCSYNNLMYVNLENSAIASASYCSLETDEKEFSHYYDSEKKMPYIDLKKEGVEAEYLSRFTVLSSGEGDGFTYDKETGRIYLDIDRGVGKQRCYVEYDTKGGGQFWFYINIKHLLKTNQVQPSSCTEDGYVETRCAECSMTVRNPIKAKGHSFNAFVTPPTCTAQGYTEHKCSVCGYSYIDSYTDIIEHSWDEGVITKQPSYTATGIKLFTCTECGATKEETVPKHNTPTDEETEKAPVNKKIKKVNKIKTKSHSKTKSMEITFSPVKGALNYRIMYRRVGDKGWTGRWTNGKTSYTLKKLKANQLYEFRFAAYKIVNGQWQRGDYSVTSRRYYYKQKIKKAIAGKGAVTLKWTKDKKADGYLIYYSTKKSDLKGSTNKSTCVKVANKKVAVKTIKGLKSKKMYYFRIRSYKTKNGNTYYGELSKFKSIKTK